MALTIGILGLPNVGKSTLFNALTRNQVLAANYPFATIEPNVGVVDLPDPRLGQLAEIFGSSAIIPAAVTFVDIAGIVAGAAEGEGLGNQFLAQVREADAVAQVVRSFADDDVVHVAGRVDPASDMETVQTELMLADLQTLEKAVPRMKKEVAQRRGEPAKLAAAEWIQAQLELGVFPPRFDDSASSEAEGCRLLRDLGLLSLKPFIYVFNADQGTLADPAAQEQLRQLVAPRPAVILDAQFEAELVELSPEDAAEMLVESGPEESGPKESGLQQLARVGFQVLGLQTYLTAGPKEARAWTIRRGWKAPQAAGVIHSDFEKKFIKAEVMAFGDLLGCGSPQGVRSAGKARLEGKDYVVQDGDVIEFRVGA